MVLHSKSNPLLFIELNVCIACGYYLPETRIQELTEFLESRKVTKIDLNCLIEVLKYHKQLEL